MSVLGIGYACVWFAFVLYVGWVGRQQRRLALRLEEIARCTDLQVPLQRRAA
jgi:CcmD family protein